MLKLDNSDLEPIDPNGTNWFVCLRGYFNTNVPNKVLTQYYEYLESREINIGYTIEETLKIIKKVVLEITIEEKELQILKDTVFTTTFYWFYKHSISYKKDVSGIIVDGSFRNEPVFIQRELNDIKGIGKEIYNQSIVGILKDLTLREEIELKGNVYKKEQNSRGDGTVLLRKISEKGPKTIWENIESSLSILKGPATSFIYEDEKLIHRDVVEISKSGDLSYTYNGSSYRVTHLESGVTIYNYNGSTQPHLLLLESDGEYGGAVCILNDYGKIIRINLLESDGNINRIGCIDLDLKKLAKFRNRKYKSRKADQYISKIEYKKDENKIMIYESRPVLIFPKELEGKEKESFTAVKKFPNCEKEGVTFTLEEKVINEFEL